MERSHAFETVLALALVGLAGLLFYVIVSTPQPAQGWEMQGNRSVDYMFTGSDDTLYVFQGSNITAIGSDGRIAWSLHVADEWQVGNQLQNGWNAPISGEADGRLYLYLTRPSSVRLAAPVVPTASLNTYVLYDVDAEVMAISRDGTVAWEHPFTGQVLPWTNNNNDDYHLADSAVVQPRDGRVLVYHDHRQDVLDGGGRLLFSIGNISGPVAVDSRGRMYAVVATKPGFRANGSMEYPDWTGVEQLKDYPQYSNEDYLRIMYDPSYMIKTSVVEGLDANGNLLWTRDIGEKVVDTYDNFGYGVPKFATLPLCVNDTLYVAVANGTAALDTDGNVRWITHLTGGKFYPFVELPVDDRGNVYMCPWGQVGGYQYVYSINPDGTVAPEPWKYPLEDVAYTNPAARSDGTVYVITNSSMYPFQAFNESGQGGQMLINTLTAYDAGVRRTLWSYSVPAGDVRRVTLNADNIAVAIPGGIGQAIFEMNAQPGLYQGAPADAVTLVPMQDHRITINPGKNVVYLSYYSIIYENPVVFNRSRAAYVNSLYALDNNGTLLWKQPMDGFVTHAVARNDTFYYSTDSGRIGGNKVNIAAGVALAAAAYVFLRFFALGTVARARTRVESNKNRNDLLRFVNENPGVTAVDISRGIEMNLGTVRYHLFILTANHKIVSHKDDGKFLRYFRNSGTYTPQERSWLSLMRREPMRCVLASLERRPGQSMQQLAKELDMSQTAVHNHISELSARGIVDRSPGDERGYAYMIKEEYRPYVSKTMERL